MSNKIFSSVFEIEPLIQGIIVWAALHIPITIKSTLFYLAEGVVRSASLAGFRGACRTSTINLSLNPANFRFLGPGTLFFFLFSRLSLSSSSFYHPFSILFHPLGYDYLLSTVSLASSNQRGLLNESEKTGVRIKKERANLKEKDEKG